LRLAVPVATAWVALAVAIGWTEGLGWVAGAFWLLCAAALALGLTRRGSGPAHIQTGRRALAQQIALAAAASALLLTVAAAIAPGRYPAVMTTAADASSTHLTVRVTQAV